MIHLHSWSSIVTLGPRLITLSKVRKHVLKAFKCIYLLIYGCFTGISRYLWVGTWVGHLFYFDDLLTVSLTSAHFPCVLLSWLSFYLFIFAPFIVSSMQIYEIHNSVSSLHVIIVLVLMFFIYNWNLLLCVWIGVEWGGGGCFNCFYSVKCSMLLYLSENYSFK